MEAPTPTPATTRARFRSLVEPRELARERARFAWGIAWVFLGVSIGLWVLSAFHVDVSVAPSALRAMPLAAALVVFVVWRWPDVGRHLLPASAAAAVVTGVTEPFLTSQFAPSVLVPAIGAALTSNELGLLVVLVSTYAGLTTRGGVESPYFRADLVLVCTGAGMLLVLMQRLVVSLYQRVASVERRISTIVSETNDVIALSRPTAEGAHDVRFVSDAAERVLGVDPDELRARGLGIAFPRDERARLHAELARVSSEPGGQTSFELRTIGGAGRQLDVRVTNLLDHPDVAGVVTTLRDVTDSRRAQEELERQLAHQASHDPLTGLPNRRLLLERTAEALERFQGGSPPFALLFCDVDNFKLVNDSLGHTVGDRLLVAVAGRLAASLGARDLAARFGGDELVVLAPDAHTAEEALVLAQRLLHALAEPVAVGTHSLRIEMSVGVVLSRADHQLAEDLLRDADVAMYRAKEAGKNRAELFEDALRAKLSRRHDLEQALRSAVEHGELTLHFQPTYRLTPSRTNGERASGQLEGFEALVRWEHPERGTLSPAEFIPIAEETGLVVPLGRWVLERGCGWFAELLRARAHEPELRALRLAINLSGRQLEDPRLCDDVAHALAQAGLEPRHLTLEVTESVAMTNAATSLGRLERLREMGVHLAIDDFGTGYSSLAYLRRLPAHVLKIDRSFVRGLGIDAEDVQIARFLVDLARTLGLSTVAEGVETAEQLELLASLGCDVVQGFFLSPPLPAPQAMRAPTAWTAEARTPEAPPSEAASTDPPRREAAPAPALAAAPQPAA